MGLTVLDAGVLIGLLDADDGHHASARSAVAAALDRGDDLAIPASALAEAVVAPFRRSDDSADVVSRLITRMPIAVAEIDEEIAMAAGRLRATERSLKLPDALVIATAQVCSADLLVTTDRKWPPGERLGGGPSICVI